MKLTTIVGARPQFVKAAMVSRAIVERNRRGGFPIQEDILHTGQHYDDNMSDVFFRQMGIPPPCANLGVGSGPHGATTARMLEGLEREIEQRRPDWVLVYGDTNSTLAGALAAAKLQVRLAHVEAGLRSFNRRMPEEINRVVADHLSDLRLCPTRTAVANLAAEGCAKGAWHVGDVMYDAALAFGDLAAAASPILRDLGLEPKRYALATVHRAENVDDPTRLGEIFRALGELARNETIVFPVHPRTRGKLAVLGPLPQGLRALDPVSFLDMVQLEKNAHIILTDSGGVQKEAYFHGVPCVTMRDETEWTETVEAGWNRVAGADRARIVAAARDARAGRPIADYGQGNSAAAVLDCLEKAGR